MLTQQRYFPLSIAFILCQQIALAMSTYYIASAGVALVQNEPIQIKNNIVLFFAFALVAYFLSSCATFMQVKLRNNLWLEYTQDIFKKFTTDQALSSKDNKEKTVHWIAGEAPSAFQEITQFSCEMVSIYCNLIFTLFVFSLTLGWKVTCAIAFSLLGSVLFVSLLKNKIKYYADEIQSLKVSVFTAIPKLWDNSFFGNKGMVNSNLSSFKNQAREYFKITEKYSLLEQVFACLPIYITVPLLMIMVTLGQLPVATIGALVAVLPRSLQLLGNVHALSIYNSRLILIRRKYKNLKDFTQSLSRQDLLSQINENHIKICDTATKETICTLEFLDNIKNKILTQGRYLICGPNGSGKSSLLKLIKIHFSEAILVSAEADIAVTSYSNSLGEKQVKKIEEIFSQPNEIYLLDEWDANLDQPNCTKIDSMIDNIKNQSLILEVRHIN